jgi:hypothetical protein
MNKTALVLDVWLSVKSLSRDAYDIVYLRLQAQGSKFKSDHRVVNSGTHLIHRDKQTINLRWGYPGCGFGNNLTRMSELLPQAISTRDPLNEKEKLCKRHKTE